MEIIGWALALIIGITLGLLGGGGSVLTVPVLVYLLKIEPVTATAYSLFIVGLSSLFGAAGYFRKGLVNVQTAITFGIPALLAVYLTRRFLVPAIPDPVVNIEVFLFSKDAAIMVLFALLMVGASYSMIRPSKSSPVLKDDEALKFNYPMIVLEGSVVGVLTGIVGAGGGFLIIPALVMFSRLPMKMAVGTSLAIIAAKSLIGFIGDIQNLPINWLFLLTFSALAIAGTLVGAKLSGKVPDTKLKPAFGWFILIIGIGIILKETLL